ncbi:hypothetical protein FQN60_018568 [Etheostoma spectabile]|uniref:Diacylglycerol kinase n=1 Tax=Etheostoma spectabile TaxID=54343 RepID=A0A5J5DIM5_9PERO|nr:hypothetical protein FQN60_018568 [Etheostoma spectabile]
MTARRDASQPLSTSCLRERKGAAERPKANPDWVCLSPRQEPEKGPVSAAGIHAHVVGAVAGSGAAEESSDSEAEQEGPQKLIRKVSTSGQIRSKSLKLSLQTLRSKTKSPAVKSLTAFVRNFNSSSVPKQTGNFTTSIKEGLLLKQTSSFQRWKKRYFKLRGRTLYYAKDAKSLIFDEVDLSDASVAESSTKNVNNSFTTAQFNVEHFSGMHNWYACSHARPTFCNVCKDSLSGVTSHGLSCEVCKFKAHKRCAVRATNNCKWTTLASIGKDIIEDEDGVIALHLLTFQDSLSPNAGWEEGEFACNWLRGRQEHVLERCFWKATCPPSCASPLLVFVNSKSGDNQGVKFLRRFKQLLNPAQVFDLVNGGPHLGLRLFQKFDNFRILVCGGDGSVGWVLSEIDKLNLHKQCQLGVLPLGTGNDLARVLGWGPSCDDDTQLPQILEKLERASTKMLDRWSIMTYEIKIPPKLSCPTTPEGADDCQFHISTYEDSVAAHLTKILNSEQNSVVISSANREQMMLRANSLKKAVRQIIEQAEKEDTELPSPLDFRKDSEEENRDSEKDEDTKEQEAVTSAKSPCSPTERRVSRSTQSYGSFTITPAGLAASIAGSSIISKMLLANIDPFGATPFIDPDLDSLEGYMEKCVMNNYFGIGLDAKISLEFNNKREEHPEKCRSRTKNMMWYGVLGTKELLQRTYKNLEQKVQLECDGQYIPLPSLQGIAVLNIPSYAGGTNFWGGTKEDDIFCAPSFDDKILEVVAVFGSMQMAVSRVIKLQHHRIAQCRTVKITILGDEGVPIQVDGEAWIQPPGAFENTLKSWEDKLKYDKPPLRPHLYSQQSVDLATEEEAALVQMCARAAEELITRICEAAKTNGLLEQELAHAVNASSHAINKTHPKFPESLTRNTAIEVASTVKALYNETESLLLGRVSLQLDQPEEDQLSSALQSLELELGKLGEVPWLYHILQPNDEEDHSLGYGKRNSRSSMFRIVPKFKKEKAAKKTSPQSVERWGTEEVGIWLEQLSLGEYRDTFIRHDIRGSELLHLERRDLKDLGISKVGHMKRILQGTKDLAKVSMVDL